ncbi:hypothetical protein GCM10027425_20050 [Alteromonas gracilis]
MDPRTYRVPRRTGTLFTVHDTDLDAAAVSVAEEQRWATPVGHDARPPDLEAAGMRTLLIGASRIAPWLVTRELAQGTTVDVVTDDPDPWTVLAHALRTRRLRVRSAHEGDESGTADLVVHDLQPGSHGRLPHRYGQASLTLADLPGAIPSATVISAHQVVVGPSPAVLSAPAQVATLVGPQAAGALGSLQPDQVLAGPVGRAQVYALAPTAGERGLIGV